MDYITPKSLLVIAILFMNLTTILVLLLFVSTCTEKKRPLGVDGRFLVASWVLSVALSINMITAVAYGAWGLILPLLTDEIGVIDALYGYSAALAEAQKFQYVQEVILVPQLACAKLSIVFFIRRTLVVSKRGLMHWSTLAAICLIVLWCIGFFFAYVFQCGTHFSLVWDGPIIANLEECVASVLELAFCVVDVILDLIIAVLPMHRIFSLKMSIRSKLQVALAFILGSLSILGATIRLAAFASNFLGVENEFTMMDPTLLPSLFMYWAMFESGFAVTTASLPILRPLLNRFAGSFDPRWTRWTRKSSRNISPTSSDMTIVVKTDYSVHISAA